MKKNYVILALTALITFSSSVTAQVFDLSSTKNSSIIINQDAPAVYKPSKLIIGNKTKFVIKAAPGSHVSLVTSEQNGGSPELYGHKLRLGQTLNPYEGIVGDKGILEIEISLPEEKELVGKILYFEVLVWKKSDFSDLKIAKIMGIDGRETDVNAVIIAEPPKKQSMPGIGPGVPGTGGDINKAMEIFHKMNESSTNQNSENYYENDIFSNNKPLMLRNLKLPELQKTK